MRLGSISIQMLSMCKRKENPCQNNIYTEIRHQFYMNQNALANKHLSIVLKFPLQAFHLNQSRSETDEKILVEFSIHPKCVEHMLTMETAVKYQYIERINAE